MCETERLGQNHTAMHCCVLTTARDQETWAQVLPSLLLVVTLLPAGLLVSPEGDFGQGPRSPMVSQGQTWMMGVGGVYRSYRCFSAASYPSVSKNVKGLDGDMHLFWKF